ncbi:MAG: 2-phospho-L-lactate transferase, partial [Actinomycetia bacterium]|nr:2-phospho-L-lactate transferase [Actinomycetes bacterium]
MHTVVAGGVGAARYLRGAVAALDPSSITAIVNVGDDVIMHGLHVSPDLDTCTYTLAGAIDPERGWGLVDESWQAMAQLGRYGGDHWFGPGDRDPGTHLFRTTRLSEGASLTEVTAEISATWGLGCTLLPITDDRLETRVTIEGGSEINFQEYFVRLAHNVAVSAVTFAGADQAQPTSEAIAAITDADSLVIAPSNPIVSIGPILAV